MVIIVKKCVIAISFIIILCIGFIPYYLHLKIKYDIKIIGDELSFNHHYDERAILFIKRMRITGKVNWVWFHHINMINLDYLEFDSPENIDLAVNNDSGYSYKYNNIYIKKRGKH